MKIKFIKNFVLMVIIFVTSPPAYTAELEVEGLKVALETHVKNELAVGIFVGFIDDGQQEILKMGFADKVSEVTISEDSLFEIGSISKTFTGILLADMVLKGEVKIDDPVSKHLPEGVLMPSRNGEQITLLNLATHSSGLPRMPDNFAPTDPSNPYVDYDATNLYEFLSNHKLRRDIGGEIEYSNLGMGLLGHVLSLRAGLSYEELVKERILVPLNMHDTTITISNEQEARFVTGHDMIGAAVPHWDLSVLAGAGAIRSTGADMMRYLSANMGLMKSSLSSALKLSHDIRREFETENMDIGLAWLTQTNTDGIVVWHNGGTGGFRSFIGWDDEKKRGVVVMTNSMDDPDQIGFSILNNQIDDLVYEKPAPVENAEIYIGEFELAPDFILTVSVEDDQLLIQLTGQPNVPVFYKEKNEFFYKIVDASISFIQGEDGNVTSLILHQGGDHPAKKIQ